jgi:hypothetical protein
MVMSLSSSLFCRVKEVSREKGKDVKGLDLKINHHLLNNKELQE